MSHGYEQREELRRFQLVRQVPTNSGGPIDVIVDFLMPRDARKRYGGFSSGREFYIIRIMK
jgi:hypothetical protein